MDTKDVIYKFRTELGLSQDQLAEKIFVTRQAISRWEKGETLPNTEALKMLSILFDVSINTLLGSPRKLVCRCCGASLDDSLLSKEPDGEFNEEYCKCCYSDGEFTNDFWKHYIAIGGEEMFEEFKAQIISELNALNIDGMPKVENLNILNGSYVNLEYPLPGGQSAKFLDDERAYLGTQLECEFGGGCFGIVAGMDFILVCSYDGNGENPELLLYKKR